MSIHALTDQEFSRFQRFISEEAGISLSSAKKALVAGRLERRLQSLSMSTFSEYLRHIANPQHSGEAQTAIDLLTTNETYFFREPKHFDILRERVLKSAATRPDFRIWSAASSSGEEAYSAAMVLADCLGLESAAWQIVGTDISTRVLARARRGHYPLARIEHIPKDYLRRYCLRGTGQQEGTLLIDRRLRARVSFSQVNLNEQLPAMPQFDVIFLRNVMIYFDTDTKRAVIARLLPMLRADGLFFVSHSESLNGLTDALAAVGPSVYSRAGRP